MKLETLFERYVGKEKPFNSFRELAIASEINRSTLSKIRSGTYTPNLQQLRGIIHAICQNLPGNNDFDVLIAFSKYFDLTTGKNLYDAHRKEPSNYVKRLMDYLTVGILPQVGFAEIEKDERTGQAIGLKGFLVDLLFQIANYGKFSIVFHKKKEVGRKAKHGSSDEYNDLEGYHETLFALNRNDNVPDFVIGTCTPLRSRKEKIAFSLPFLGLRFPVSMIFLNYDSSSSNDIHFSDIVNENVLRRIWPIGCVRSEVGHEFIRTNLPCNLIEKSALGGNVIKLYDAYDAEQFAKALRTREINSVVADGPLIDEIKTFLEEHDPVQYILRSNSNVNSRIDPTHLHRYPICFAMAKDIEFVNRFNQAMLDFYLECPESIAALYEKHFNAVFHYRADLKDDGDRELTGELHKLEKQALSTLDSIARRKQHNDNNSNNQ